MPADDWAGPFRRCPERSGVFTDFDGVLAHIEDDPTGVQPLPGVVPMLEALAARFALVSVVSGRPVAFLLQHLRCAGVRLVGQYGLEWIHGEDAGTDPIGARWCDAIAAAAAAARSELPAGLLVEEKSASLTLHYREQPEQAALVIGWARRYAERSGLVVRPAKAAVELHAPVAVDKGTAVLDASSGLEAIIFLGDDEGDLPAFAALDRLAVEGVHTVKVAVTSSEVPPGLVAAADIVVAGPAEAVELLGQLFDPAT